MITISALGLVVFLVCGILAVLFVPNMHRVSESFSSLLSGDLSLISDRLYFSALSLRVFAHYPLTGIGPLHFQDVMTSFADLYAVPLKLWIDNPNNSYLGFLAEMGLLGVVLIVLSVRRLHFHQQLAQSTTQQVITRCGIYAFLFVLVFGPHYLFPEISLTFALLSACGFRAEFTQKGRLIPIALVLISAPLVFLVARGGEFGLYHWEKSPEGEVFRWTEPTFRTWIPCVDGAAKLRVRNAQQAQVVMRATGAASELKALSLESGEEQRVQFQCPRGYPFQGIPVEGAVVPVWQPGEADRRVLGVQLFHDSPRSVLEAQFVDKGSESG